MTVERLTGGQSNPTFRLSTPGAAYVLRRKPFGDLLPSAHAVEREYRVMRALSGSAVPVPQVHGLCEDPSIAGTTFFVMDFVPGRIFEDSRMPPLAREERSALFDAMNTVIAALHAIDPASVGLADFGRPGNYIERQVARWTKAVPCLHHPADRGDGADHRMAAPVICPRSMAAASFMAITKSTTSFSIRPKPESSRFSTGNSQPSAIRWRISPSI